MTAVLAPAPSDTMSFAPLVRVITDHGLLLRRRRRYLLTIAADLGLLVLTGAAMVALGPSWWQLALAIPAALAFTRIAFLGHDAGHKQIARTARVNRALGLIAGNLLVGMSYGWWVSKHSRHHAHPNDVTRDPDVGNGVLAWTPEQAAGRQGFAGWLVRHQALMFFPLLTLEAVHLRVSSWRSLRSPLRSPVETALLTVNLVGYLAFVFTVMDPVQAVAFVALHHTLFGLHLGCAFAPNHKGMPMPAPGQRWSHLQRQVVTSRNVRGGPVTDWLLGGLNYQIEHHLFPSMPRPSLRAAQLFVRAHCAHVALPYTEEPALTSYRHALRHLDTAGNP